LIEELIDSYLLDCCCYQCPDKIEVRAFLDSYKLPQKECSAGNMSVVTAIKQEIVSSNRLHSSLDPLVVLISLLISMLAELLPCVPNFISSLQYSISSVCSWVLLMDCAQVIAITTVGSTNGVGGFFPEGLNGVITTPAGTH
jgi:hypothetical protein